MHDKQQRESNNSTGAQQEGVQQDAMVADAGGSAGVEPSTPPTPEQLAQDQNQETDTAEGAAAPARAAALTDAGAPAVSAALVELKAAACSAGGSLGALGPGSSSGQTAPGLVRRVLPQLPLPHLLHLELDGCRWDMLCCSNASSPGAGYWLHQEAYMSALGVSMILKSEQGAPCRPGCAQVFRPP